MDDELKKELQKRGTAEISNGIVTQVTQAISESDKEVTFLIFGEMRKQGIIPIDEACAKCDHCYFRTIKQCQTHQKRDAVARGFNNLICPQQFIKDGE
jgi:hypothetical protein